jgi:hypothetical protein
MGEVLFVREAGDLAGPHGPGARQRAQGPIHHGHAYPLPARRHSHHDLRQYAYAVGKAGWNKQLAEREQTIEDLKFNNYKKEIFFDSDTKIFRHLLVGQEPVLLDVGGRNGIAGLVAAGSSRHRQKIAAIPAAQAPAEILALGRAAYPQRRSSTANSLCGPEFGWIPGNLCNLSKGYFATKFLSRVLSAQPRSRVSTSQHAGST